MFNVPFYMPYDYYSNWLSTNFASLQLTDDIKFFTYVFMNCFILVCIIILLKFLINLIFYFKKKVFD